MARQLRRFRESLDNHICKEIPMDSINRMTRINRLLVPNATTDPTYFLYL